MTAIIEETRQTTSTDKNECAHIVLEKGNEETAHAYVMRARIEGFPIIALCGFTWIPNKKATGLPVCEECKSIYENDPMNHGDRGDLPDE
jgi:hypothetical protein